MSPRDSSSHGPYRKPRADVYTVMLVLALLAIVCGCIFLYFEVADYPDTPPWSGAPSAQLDVPYAVPSGAVASPMPAEAGRFASHRRAFPFLA